MVLPVTVPGVNTAAVPIIRAAPPVPARAWPFVGKLSVTVLSPSYATEEKF